MYDKDALQGKTLAELREIGRQFGIKAQMRKQELADKIIELSAQQNVAAVSTESEQSAVEQPQRRPGRPRKQNVVAEEKSAVKIGRVIQGEPYRKQRGRRAKDNKENGEHLVENASVATAAQTTVTTNAEPTGIRQSIAAMRGDAANSVKRHKRERITFNKAVRNTVSEPDPEAELLQEAEVDYSDIPELPIAETPAAEMPKQVELAMADHEDVATNLFPSPIFVGMLRMTSWVMLRVKVFWR